MSVKKIVTTNLIHVHRPSDFFCFVFVIVLIEMSAREIQNIAITELRNGDLWDGNGNYFTDV